MKEVAVIDYGMGNLASVQKKINRLGGAAIITSDKKEIENASKIILPGVGHFAMAVENIKKRELWDILNEKVISMRTPILGICLGMQLMAQCSEEGNAKGFGWFNAKIVRFKIRNQINFKIPHMGWNNVELMKSSAITEGLDRDSEFYFVHSYHAVTDDNDEILMTTEYEYPFVSGLQKNNIFGLQFHPEKSHEFGDIILNNFIKL